MATERGHSASRLLKKLVATRWFAPDAIARALVVSEDTITAYLSEAQTIPLDRQLCLALFVIECVPPLARAGHRLHAQVVAAIAFHERVTETHPQPPPSRWFDIH